MGIEVRWHSKLEEYRWSLAQLVSTRCLRMESKTMKLKLGQLMMKWRVRTRTRTKTETVSE